MIDDEIGRNLRVDQRSRRLGTGHPHDCVSHGGQVDHGRDAGEVLQYNAGRFEGYFGLADLGCVVLRHGPYVAVCDHAAIVIPQRRFEKHLDRVRQSIDVTHVPESIEAVNDALTERRVNGGPGAKGIVRHGAASQQCSGLVRPMI